MTLKKRLIQFTCLILALLPLTGCPDPMNGSGDEVISGSALDLTSLIPLPAAGAAPIADIPAQTGYTGTITWSPEGDTFLPGTVYTAAVTLSAQSGYTFDGVKANSFTYTGAKSVTNAANSGEVTIVFLPTIGTIGGNALDLTSRVPAPVIGQTPQLGFTTDAYNGAITWKDGIRSPGMGKGIFLHTVKGIVGFGGQDCCCRISCFGCK
ncbi:hypothetical protein FACS189473_5700 [Spirochaetia bacterium]|nr:hypothetical protein FACS189473_5700 [Spirochaetia bacterium]